MTFIDYGIKNNSAKSQPFFIVKRLDGLLYLFFKN